ncbi:MAG TPA: hypothetical protein VLA77_01595 [Candidatus Saccharimonadales bacterium]|nr:hypothetical protein [Candidatus Saccharimonadales bacterium]
MEYILGANPWYDQISDTELGEQIARAIQFGGQYASAHLALGSFDFTMAILNPTDPWHSNTPLDQRIMTTIVFGDKAQEQMEFVLAKLAAHLKFGVSTSDILSRQRHLLTRHDCGVPGSIVYDDVIAAGHGLSAQQSTVLTKKITQSFVNGIRGLLLTKFPDCDWLNTTNSRPPHLQAMAGRILSAPTIPVITAMV